MPPKRMPPKRERESIALQNYAEMILPLDTLSQFPCQPIDQMGKG